uniref:PIN domain-containing protein n=1 Tax=Salix viminalis TaxID=40686 RepID=A0A6N2MAM3_SALVM
MTAISVATSHTMKLTISIFVHASTLQNGISLLESPIFILHMLICYDGFWKIWNGGGCNSKTAAKMAVARIKLLRNKREAVMRQMRRDIALLLRSGQDATARIRCVVVEHVIREQNVFAANEFIELFCELVVSRLSIIAKRRECPADLKEGIASLIFASPRCSEIPELVALRKIFEKKYGKDFVSAATDLRPNSGVNRLLIDKLSVRPPSGEVKLKVMKEIANIDNYIRSHYPGNEGTRPIQTDINHVYRTATLRRCQSRWMVKMCPGDTVTLAHTPQPKPLLIRQKPAKHTERDRQTGPSKALNLTIEPTNRERRTLNFGRIQKLVREVYLRDDIYCGALFCKSCEDKSKARSTILVLDTNVVLNQIDLLENPAIEDVVLLSVVTENLIDSPARRFVVFSNEFHRHTYVQTMAGESPNDRNDRAIRVAARWYQSHLGEAVKVLLITNDRENNRKATEEGVSAETIESYVKSLGQPALLDLLVQPASEDVTMEEVEDMRPSKRKVVYPEHKPMSEITSGLTKVIYHQGKLRVNRYNPFEAYVGSESIGDEIIIYGRGNMNRAFDGDVVAVELLPQDQWNEEKSLSPCSQNNEAEARIQRGALTLASAEVKFQIDTETHDPLDIGYVSDSRSKPNGEEFMLAANRDLSDV